MALPYRSFSTYLKEEFGCAVYKITLDIGNTCPNRDGRIAYGGCTFCDIDGSGPGRERSQLSVSQQLAEAKGFMTQRYGAKKFIAYFQAYTATYTTPEKLRDLLEEALSVSDIVGLDVATRSDCLPDPIVDELVKYKDRTHFWLELGLQTANDEVLKRVNRGHDVANFVGAAQKMKKLGFRMCAHIILGLPGDDWDHMMKSAGLISDLGFDAVKLHHLHVLKDSPMENQWKKGMIPLLTLDEYARLTVDFLERVPSSMVIQRLAGSSTPGKLLAPMWTLDKAKTIQAIENEFKKRNSFQGKIYGREKSPERSRRIGPAS